MEISPVSVSDTRPAICSRDYLHELSSTASDPESEIEALLLKNSQHQKRTASHLQKVFMREKTLTLEKAFEKMKDAGTWKIGGSILNIALKMAATVVESYCGGNTRLLSAGLDAAGSNNLLDYKADECNLGAEQKKAGAETLGMRSSGHAQWLKDTKSLEIKMLDHLESLDTKRHEEKKTIMQA